MSRTDKSSRRSGPPDIGTLWMMQRADHSARCAVLAEGGTWTIRVLVDGALLLEEHFRDADGAFTVGKEWRLRMVSQGWQQIVPRGRRATLSEERLSF